MEYISDIDWQRKAYFNQRTLKFFQQMQKYFNALEILPSKAMTRSVSGECYKLVFLLNRNIQIPS